MAKIVTMGEIMLRLDPGEGRIRTANMAWVRSMSPAAGNGWAFIFWRQALL